MRTFFRSSGEAEGRQAQRGQAPGQRQRFLDAAPRREEEKFSCKISNRERKASGLQAWVEMGAFEVVLAKIGSMVEERNGFKLDESNVDGTFSKTKACRDKIGRTKAGKGVKIMIMEGCQAASQTQPIPAAPALTKAIWLSRFSASSVEPWLWADVKTTAHPASAGRKSTAMFQGFIYLACAFSS